MRAKTNHNFLPKITFQKGASPKLFKKIKNPKGGHGPILPVLNTLQPPIPGMSDDILFSTYGDKNYRPIPEETRRWRRVAKVKSATVSHISGLATKLKYKVTSKKLTYFLLKPWLILLFPVGINLQLYILKHKVLRLRPIDGSIFGVPWLSGCAKAVE